LSLRLRAGREATLPPIARCDAATWLTVREHGGVGGVSMRRARSSTSRAPVSARCRWRPRATPRRCSVHGRKPRGR